MELRPRAFREVFGFTEIFHLSQHPTENASGIIPYGGIRRKSSDLAVEIEVINVVFFCVHKAKHQPRSLEEAMVWTVRTLVLLECVF